MRLLERWFRLGPGEVKPMQLDRLMRVSTVVLVLSSIGAAVSCWQYLDGPARIPLLVWLCLFFAVSLARRFFGWRYMRQAASVHASETSLRRWMLWGMVSTLVHTLQWGLLSVVLIAPGSAEAESVLHITLAAVAMGTAVHLAAFYRVLAACVVCVVGPLVLRDLFIGGGYHLLMAMMSFLIGVYTLLNGRNQAQLLAALQQESERSDAARRAAEEASAARTRFFAAANHDLRQPLHAMGLLAQTLSTQAARAERVDVAELAEVSGHLVECVDGMTHVVDDLLEITRLDAGNITAKGSAFAVDALLREACQPYQALARAKGLQLVVQAPPLVVQSDRALVARVLGNLVSNAIRYTREGAVTVEARDDNTHVRLIVQDTGIGIAADHVPRIFEEFYQVGNPARDRRLGLGLGLATVKRLSDLLGLAVSVQSTPGQGSRFELRLSRASAHEVAAMPAAADTAALPLVTSQCVLVIEDDADSRNALLGLLRQWGCDARAAPGAREALVWIEQGFRPDALVVDLRLSDGASGLDAIAAVREAVGTELPTLVVTGDAGSDHLRRAESLGLPVLVKPARPMQLRAFLSQVRTAA
ncbi:MAG: hybrid sensor histidine kinase/response regulator [Rhizobacter sp.]